MGISQVKKKKIGRPTDNPKSKPRQIRLDEESHHILEKYCAKENITQAEAIRRGIKKLKEDIQ